MVCGTVNVSWSLWYSNYARQMTLVSAQIDVTFMWNPFAMAEINSTFNLIKSPASHQKLGFERDKVSHIICHTNEMASGKQRYSFKFSKHKLISLNFRLWASHDKSRWIKKKWISSKGKCSSFAVSSWIGKREAYIFALVYANASNEID